MQNRKSVFVTGATGNQGGAVVRHLLGKGYQVKALVRKPGSPSAKSLIQENVEIIKGDLNDPESYRSHLKNLDAVFCNLHFKEGTDKEIRQGFNFVTVSKEQGVKHIIYSSVVGCDLNTGIPHWESKWKIENHIRSAGIDFTILRPSSLFENLLLPQVRGRILKGKLVLPTRADKVQQFICANDIGRVSAVILSDPEKYTGRTIMLASEQMDGIELAAVFSKVLNKDIKFQQLPKLIVRLVMGKGLAKMFRWVNDNDVVFIKDIDELKKEFQGMMSIEKWIEINFKQS